MQKLQTMTDSSFKLLFFFVVNFYNRNNFPNSPPDYKYLQRDTSLPPLHLVTRSSIHCYLSLPAAAQDIIVWRLLTVTGHPAVISHIAVIKPSIVYP